VINLKKNKEQKPQPSSTAPATVQPDRMTEMGVPIPSEINVEQAKECGEENEK